MRAFEFEASQAMADSAEDADELCTHTDTRGHRHTDTQEVERIMNILTLTWSVRTPETWLTMEEISEWDAAPARKWSTRDCSMMRSIFASWRFVCDDVD